MKVIAEVFFPENLYDVDSLDRVINNFLNESALAAKVDFNVTQQTWSKKATFKIKKGNYSREISTDNDIYAFVNYGTRPHDITPRNAPKLRFQAEYKAKTMVRKIMSRAGGPSGPVVLADKVRHPGTEGRFFDEEIALKWDREQPEQLQRAIDSEVD